MIPSDEDQIVGFASHFRNVVFHTSMFQTYLARSSEIAWQLGLESPKKKILEGVKFNPGHQIEPVVSNHQFLHKIQPPDQTMRIVKQTNCVKGKQCGF